MAVDTKPERERRGITLSLREQQNLGNIPLFLFCWQGWPRRIALQSSFSLPQRLGEQWSRQLCFALLGAGQPWLAVPCRDAPGLPTGLTLGAWFWYVPSINDSRIRGVKLHNLHNSRGTSLIHLALLLPVKPPSPYYSNFTDDCRG